MLNLSQLVKMRAMSRRSRPAELSYAPLLTRLATVVRSIGRRTSTVYRSASCVATAKTQSSRQWGGGGGFETGSRERMFFLGGVGRGHPSKTIELRGSNNSSPLRCREGD